MYGMQSQAAFMVKACIIWHCDFAAVASMSMCLLASTVDALSSWHLSGLFLQALGAWEAGTAAHAVIAKATKGFGSNIKNDNATDSLCMALPS